ncbi:thymidylate kinase [Candidatus Pacearchaeota archaeon]|jgi:dTMP kinase|nr:thymidylate kinase [Candidatus Pacearchaeota archaeon]
MKGKLITIEGTDASGKDTQTTLLCDRLKNEGFFVERNSFPRYNTPTGKIVGGPLLGKPEISKSYFEKPAEVDPKVASAYYVADRRNSLPFIQEILNSGTHLILDRYVESNHGHQGGKIRDPDERLNFFRWLDHLEYNMFELPRPDLTLFLYMPFEKGIELKSKMGVQLDGVEKDFDYLKNSEESYLQLADFYNWKKIDCVWENGLKTKENIHEEVYKIVKEIL